MISIFLHKKDKKVFVKNTIVFLAKTIFFW